MFIKLFHLQMRMISFYIFHRLLGHRKHVRLLPPFDLHHIW